jgi:hypothetical protein
MPVTQTDAKGLKSRLVRYASDIVHDRLPFLPWHRKISFVVQVMIYAFALPALFGTAMMGHLDYTPEQIGEKLQNLMHAIAFAMIVGLVVPSRRRFLAYLGYSTLTYLILIATMLTCMYAQSTLM